MSLGARKRFLVLFSKKNFLNRGLVSGKAADALGRSVRASPRSPGTSARQLVCAGHGVVYRLTPATGSHSTAGDILILRVFGPGQQR